MADVEFEEFSRYFDDIPQCVRASARSYTLVHDIMVEEDGNMSRSSDLNRQSVRRHSCQTNGVFEENSRNYGSCCSKPDYCDSNYSSPKRHSKTFAKCTNEKRRRTRDAEVPIKKNLEVPLSLADELEFALGEVRSSFSRYDTSDHRRKSGLEFVGEIGKTVVVYSSDEHSDSGNSTVHSPDDSLIPESVNSSNASSLTHIELLEATHRALYKFVARHSDELELEIGDPIYVQKEAEDLWCEGINLRNGNRGIFPSAYVVDVEYNDFDPSTPQVKRERFVLRYLGSVETLYHKGNSVLCQAVQKILSTNRKYQTCILEVSDHGLKMYDHIKPSRDSVPTLDYFYSLKNVSFCGFHPQDSRLMGFITKHPRCDRFACHVFQSDESTRPITESIGRAFTRFYKKYIETAYPIEDIYIE